MLVYHHVQEVAASTWTVTHNLDLTAAAVDVVVNVNGTEQVIFPSKVTKPDSNTIVIEFSSDRAGKAEIRGSTGLAVNYAGFVQPVEREIDYTHSPQTV